MSANPLFVRLGRFQLTSRLFMPILCVTVEVPVEVGVFALHENRRKEAVEAWWK